MFSAEWNLDVQYWWFRGGCGHCWPRLVVAVADRVPVFEVTVPVLVLDDY